MKDKNIRLDHFLSSSGVCARRKASTLIKKKVVMVNHEVVTDPSMRVDPKKDIILWNGKRVKKPNKIWYIAFNKPKKVLTAMSDSKGRPCVSDYFTKMKERVFPIGRLDWSSEGLILLTNDGDFAMKVLKTPKTYLLKLSGQASYSDLSKLKKGVSTEIGKLKAAYIKKSSSRNWVKVILTEGRNRQLHRMFEKIGFQIKILRRIGIGRLKLSSLKPGEAFTLNPIDIKKSLSVPKELQLDSPKDRTTKDRTTKGKVTKGISKKTGSSKK